MNDSDDYNSHMKIISFEVSNSIKVIAKQHAQERISFEYDRFGLDRQKRIKMVEMGTLGQLIFREYLEKEKIEYTFEFQAGEYDQKDFEIFDNIVEIKTSGYSENEGYRDLNAIYNFDQMQQAEAKNIHISVQIFVNGYKKSDKKFDIDNCNSAHIVGFSTIDELRNSDLKHLPFGKAYLKPLKELREIGSLEKFLKED